MTSGGGVGRRGKERKEARDAERKREGDGAVFEPSIKLCGKKLEHVVIAPLVEVAVYSEHPALNAFLVFKTTVNTDPKSLTKTVPSRPLVAAVVVVVVVVVVQVLVVVVVVGAAVAVVVVLVGAVVVVVVVLVVVAAVAVVVAAAVVVVIAAVAALSLAAGLLGPETDNTLFEVQCYDLTFPRVQARDFQARILA